MKAYRVFIFFFPCLFLLSGLAEAFDVKGLQPVQPNGIFSTFSATTTGAGYFSAGFEMEKAVDPSFYRVCATFGYDVTDRIELSATVPYMLRTNAYGFEDISVGLKHRFLDEGAVLPAFAYLLSAAPPLGLEKNSMDGRYGGGLILTKKIGPLRTSANLFLYVPQKHDLKKEVDFFVGTDLSAANNLNVLLEVLVKKSHFSSGIDVIETRLGYRYRPMDFLYTTLGGGYDFKNNEHGFKVFLNVTVVFSPGKVLEKKRIYEYEQQ